MPPTVQSGANEDRDKRARSGERKSELLCRVKYANTLPDIPFDPKFVTYPFEANRFVKYSATSLERSFKFDLLIDHDLGVPIDLINPDAYAVDPSCKLAVEDERLLEEDLSTHSVSKRSRHHNKNVSWLRKTEYISTEYSRGMQKSDKMESKVGFNIKKTFKVEDIYKDRDSQLRAIEKTFAAVGVPITKHFRNPNVKPMAVLEVHPDYELWKHPFAQVSFDSDPAPKPETTADEMAQAMIRGMVDESGEQFVAYFLPTAETMRKRKLDNDRGVAFSEDEDYDYTLAREYTWNVKNKASKGYEEMYFFSLRDNVAYYNELETRVRLTKRRGKGSSTTAGTKTRLIVRHRDINEQEAAAQEMRRSALMEDEAEEEEEDGEKEDGEEGSSDGSEEGSRKRTHASEDKASDSGSGDEEGSASKRSKGKGRSDSDGSESGSNDEEEKPAGGQDGKEGGSGDEGSKGDGSGSSSGSTGSSSGDDSGSESEAEKGGGSTVAEGEDEEKIFGSGSSSEEEESD